MQCGETREGNVLVWDGGRKGMCGGESERGEKKEGMGGGLRDREEKKVMGGMCV